MAKNAKRTEKPRVGARARLGAMSPAGLFGALLGGLPPQVRLAAREQQRPTPFVPPKSKQGRRGR
jgi:hypothetical protein